MPKSWICLDLGFCSCRCCSASQIWRLWSSAALDGNHGSYSSEAMVPKHYRKRSALLGTWLPASYSIPELCAWYFFECCWTCCSSTSYIPRLWKHQQVCLGSTNLTFSLLDTSARSILQKDGCTGRGALKERDRHGHKIESNDKEDNLG